MTSRPMVSGEPSGDQAPSEASRSMSPGFASKKIGSGVALPDPSRALEGLVAMQRDFALPRD